MFVPGLIYVSRYALAIPFVDEWVFIPVLFGDEPAAPWLWQLHNEHRFPLPRILYLELFQLSGDLRTGCLVSFLGISLCAAALVRLARIVRGRSNIVDAVFPLMLMHTGQGENLYTGYQMCFMLVNVLAVALLAVIVRCGMTLRVLPHDGPHCATLLFRFGLMAAGIGLLLLACGAAGLCYGVAATGWVVLLAAAAKMQWSHRIVLLALAAMTPLYIVLYFQGYHRPSHHPDSAGVLESIRIGLEAQAMAFGPAATGLWPVVGIGILGAGVWIGLLLALTIRRKRTDFGAIGLLMFVVAGAAVAFGIGWGRSGFLRDMGFAWRYGWITFPPIAVAYFTWLIRRGRVSTYGPLALFLVAAIFAPINTISGFLDAERNLKPFADAWETDVRSGVMADDLVNKHFASASPAMRKQMADVVRLMRDHRYTYYESLGREEP